jgi:hypothetical protein
MNGVADSSSLNKPNKNKFKYMHAYFFYFLYVYIFLFFIFYFLFFGGWAQLSPCGWAGPSRPSRVTGLTRLAIFFYQQACVSSSRTPAIGACN